MSLTIGIDIGGTKIACGLVDESGTILQMDRLSTPSRDPESVESAIIELVLEYASENEVEAVGIGCAGFIDEQRSRVLLAPNLSWVDEPLKLAIESKVNLPVVVENDANAAAWGEFKFGGGQGTADMACVTVGTGIGGGFVFNGALYRGAHGIAAEIGHMVIEPGGRLCGCGNRGCWEQYASGNALVREARKLAADRRDEAEVLLDFGDGTPEGVQGKHITEAASLGDTVALAAFASLAHWLGVGMANVTALLDPGCFIIGGGVSEAGELFLGATRLEFKAALSGSDVRPIPEIRLASLGNLAGLAGAADLARYR